MIYRLTQSDLELVAWMAHTRNDRKVRRGIHSNKYDPNKTEYQAHYEGALGEVGAARALGGEIDTSERLAGDSGWDFQLDCGLKVEAKFRTKREWDYALDSSSISRFNADVGVLVWPGLEPGTLELVGWTTRVQLLEHGDFQNFGRGRRLVLHHSKLYPMDRLRRLVARWEGIDPRIWRYPRGMKRAPLPPPGMRVVLPSAAS